MKAKSLFKIVVFSLLFTCFFTSCENFFSGILLKDEIDKQIDYANAEIHNIRLVAKEGTGTINAGAGDNSLKVTDSITISFSKAKGYKFFKWNAVQKDNQSVSMTEYVKFGDAEI